MATNDIPRFLTTGAGGRVGASGNHAVRQLLNRGLPVRAFVFRADHRSDQLAALGAEIVVGDLRDIVAVRRAMSGVTVRLAVQSDLADGMACSLALRLSVP